MFIKDKIHLPALPTAWNRLSSKELEEVHRLIALRDRELMTMSKAEATRKFKLRAFMLFLNLKVRQKTIEENGETYFLFRRRGIRHLFETIPFKAWQVSQWIDGSLDFLDKLEERTVAPYQFIRLFGKRFKAPSDLLTSLTYEQYSLAQNLISKYWDSVGVINFLRERGRKAQAIRMAERKSVKVQCQLLAVLFNVASRQTEVRTEFSTRKVSRKVWSYDSRQINNWKYFRFAYKRIFPVMLQYFLSVQVYYSNIYPELFTNKGGSGKKANNYLIMEVDSMNQIMKYSGFSNYQDIYNSHAVFILGVLNDMNKYARSIEEMNARFKK